MNSEVMMQGLRVAAFGLLGVFAVLILFYISIKIIMKIFK